MIKKITYLAAFIMLFSVNSYSIEIKELYTKFTENKNFSAIKSVNSWKFAGELIKGKIKLDFEYHYLLPNFYRFDTYQNNAGRTIMTYNGSESWMKFPEQPPMPLQPDNLNFLYLFTKYFETPLYDDSLKIEQLKMMPDDSVGGVKCYHVLFEKNKSKTIDLYISQESLDLLKIVSIEPYGPYQLQFEFHLSDYKVIEGIRMPHRVELYSPEDERTYIIKEIKKNLELKEFDFRKPY